MTTSIESICEGCEKIKKSGICSVYLTPPAFFVRSNKCPFNPPKEVVKKAFVRVGQQKTKRAKG